METKRNKNAWVVGIFIIVGLAIFILAVFTLGGERKTFTKKFPLKVVFTDINGLKEGNNIWFSGVKIGTVKSITLKADSAVEVTLNIEEKAHPFIHKGATAKVSSDGLLGNKIVVIYPGNDKEPLVSNEDYLAVHTATTNEDMMATLQESNKNLLEISNNFKLISKRIADGEGTIGKLVNDPAIANSLQSTIDGFKIVSANSKKAIANIENFSERLTTENSSINKLLADSILYDSIKNSITALKQTITTANEFAGNLNQFASNIKNASEQLYDTTKPAGMLFNDKGTAEDLQLTLENLKAASKKLDDDLEALQHNFLFRGFFKKKQKNAGKN